MEDKKEKIAYGIVTELPCRKRNTGRRYVRITYGDKFWEITQFYYRSWNNIQQLPYCVPLKALGVDKIIYEIRKR